MAKSITSVSADLAAQFHGTTTNKITNLYGIFNRAAGQVLLDVDPQETIRISQLSTPIFNSVYGYASPTDLKGDGVIDIRPQVNRTTTGIVNQVYNQAFDVSKATTLLDKLTVQWNTNVKSLRINLPQLTTPTILNACDSLTSNGTWTAVSTASNLSVDSVDFVSNSASLKFDLAITGPTGYLENSTMASVDLSDWVSQGYFFAYVYLPTASAFTSIILRVGSSSSAYYSMTATTTQENTSFQNGWNLLSFSWAAATTTGSPSSSALNYIRATYTYSGAAQTGVRLDQITAALGQIYEIEYYSKYLFRSSGGTFQETVTADSDLINLDTETYNLFLWKVCEYTAQQVQGVDATQYDGPYFRNQYDQTLKRYQALYKSQKQLPQSTYYRIGKPNSSATRITLGR